MFSVFHSDIFNTLIVRQRQTEDRSYFGQQQIEGRWTGLSEIGSEGDVQSGEHFLKFLVKTFGFSFARLAFFHVSSKDETLVDGERERSR